MSAPACYRHKSTIWIASCSDCYAVHMPRALATRTQPAITSPAAVTAPHRTTTVAAPLRTIPRRPRLVLVPVHAIHPRTHRAA